MNIILGIETSCDDTCVAILDGDKALCNLIYSQDHNKFGGVFPEYASRNHMEALPGLVQCALQEAQVKAGQVDVIGVTYAPGLLGSLIVGLSYAKAAAWSLGCKLVAVHHIEAHILAAHYDCNIDFPYGAIVVSGGHTLIAIAHSLGKYKILGSSIDDAAGECFDKVAREIGLKQPGGPEIEKLAHSGSINLNLPIPLYKDGSCNFSFSGLKTAAIRSFDGTNAADVAASLQHAIAVTIAERLSNAMKMYPEIKDWAIVGGVAANRYIFDKVKRTLEEHGCHGHCPSKKLCTDNALMIAYAASLYEKSGKYDSLDVEPINRIDLESI
jgi:N6-L-threonylcarbamoyladenine synthase